MAKLPDHISLPVPRNDWEKQLVRVLTDYLNTNTQIVTGLQTGKIAAHLNASSSKPTQGVYAPGDFVPNLRPTNVSGGTSYLHIGWFCQTEGSASASSLVDFIILSSDTGPPFPAVSATSSSTASGGGGGGIGGSGTSGLVFPYLLFDSGDRAASQIRYDSGAPGDDFLYFDGGAFISAVSSSGVYLLYDGLGDTKILFDVSGASTDTDPFLKTDA